jgi:hypothetical protein
MGRDNGGIATTNPPLYNEYILIKNLLKKKELAEGLSVRRQRAKERCV